MVSKFRGFYEGRAAKGLLVESPRNRMSRFNELTSAEIQSLIVSMPLRKFQQRRYLDDGRDVAWIQFEADLWSQLSDEDLACIRQLCLDSIERYYARLT